MDVVRALVSVDRLEVRGVAHHLEFGGNAVAAMHVPRDSGDLQRLAAIVALDEADRLRNQLAGFEAPPDPQRCLKPKRDLGHHVGELELDQLVGGERAPELLAVERVLPGGMITGLGRAHRTPADPVASAIEASERALEPFDVGQQRVFTDLDAIHYYFAGDRGAKRELLLDLRRSQTLRALLEHEAADLAVVRVRLRPHDEY